jgi:hypothetical protein
MVALHPRLEISLPSFLDPQEFEEAVYEQAD